jgi:cysteine-rich repeat protein
MKARRIGRFLPLMALLAAGLLAVGCSDSNGGDPDPNTGGTGGGGVGGDGGTGGGSDKCGDGNLDDGEACDDGNKSNDDCCSDTCRIIDPVCGDGVAKKECGEECDDGNTDGGDGCSEICRIEACGNGYPEAGEECDDGNKVSGDGCSEDCKIECMRDQDCDPDAMEICVKAKDGEGVEAQYGKCEPTGGACDVEQHCGAVARPHCGAAGCICQPNNNDDGKNGVCWRKVESCHTCETNADCGTTSHFDRPADCVTYHMEAAGDMKVCLPRNLPNVSCPQGFVAGTAEEGEGGLDLTGYCVPQREMCPSTACDEDRDCTDPRFPVCDISRGICVIGCYINWEKSRETVGCSPGRPACHAIPELHDPALLGQCQSAQMFGYGKCGPECEKNSDCERFGNDVLGRPFVCQNDGGVRRCRPEGCLDDMECPEPTGGAEAEYMGYCSPKTMECDYTNCRTGPDPRLGCGVNENYADCTIRYKCVEDAGQEDGYGICVLKNCIDNEGANLDCKGGQFCAGEPMKDMMTGEYVGNPLPVPDNVPIGVCYDMDVPLWCETTCTPGDNSGCRQSGQPGRWALNPGYCIPTQAGNFCYFGCQYAAECPAGWSCSSAETRIYSYTAQGQTGEFGYAYCQDDFDCGAGQHCTIPKVGGVTHTAWGETYVDEIKIVQPAWKVCTCDEDADCGSGKKCNAGVAARDPELPDVEVERYCTVDTAELCGPTGSVEWYGSATGSQYDPDSAMWYNFFYCGCHPGSNDMCPLQGPAGTILQDSPTHCGMSQGDKNLCVGGQICNRKEWNDIETGETYCGVRR